ncbi:MAG: hypothetical protein DMG40_10610 [Acidobacteria bacterium]|nr:MAG: hypothetical protein DMG40_10610 [Acidobacteriota bacterium]
MSRPPLEVADIIRAAGEAFSKRDPHWLRWKHVKMLRAIERCRTAALGGHLDVRSHPLRCAPGDNYFQPKEVLKKVFRGKFVDALKEAFQHGPLHFHGDLKLLAQPKTFAAWLRPLHRQDWMVYLERPFGGPEYVVHYLGRYTHRVAISNHRLVFFADGQVTFRWRDSAHHNEQSLLTLPLDEFETREAPLYPLHFWSRDTLSK